MTSPTPTGLLHLRTWLPPELDGRFSAWCDDHHLEQLAVPGFQRVRRFELDDSLAEAPPRFLTVYDLDALDVLSGEAYAEYGRRSTGLPDFLKGHLRAARSEATIVADVPAVTGLTPAGPGLVHYFAPDGPPIDDWFAARADDLRSATDAAVARLTRTASGEQIVLLELDGDRVVDLPSLPVPAGIGGGPGWGRYRLAYEATPDGARSSSP